MPVSIIFFAAGVAWLQWQPVLPDVPGIFLMGGLALGAGLSVMRQASAELRGQAHVPQR